MNATNNTKKSSKKSNNKTVVVPVTETVVVPSETLSDALGFTPETVTGAGIPLGTTLEKFQIQLEKLTKDIVYQPIVFDETPEVPEAVTEAVLDETAIELVLAPVVTETVPETVTVEIPSGYETELKRWLTGRITRQKNGGFTPSGKKLGRVPTVQDKIVRLIKRKGSSYFEVNASRGRPEVGAILIQLKINKNLDTTGRLFDVNLSDMSWTFYEVPVVTVPEENTIVVDSVNEECDTAAVPADEQIDTEQDLKAA